MEKSTIERAKGGRANEKDKDDERTTWLNGGLLQTYIVNDAVAAVPVPVIVPVPVLVLDLLPCVLLNVVVVYWVSQLG